MSHFQTDETTFHALMGFSRWILFEIEEHQKNTLLLQCSTETDRYTEAQSKNHCIYHARQQQQNTDARKDDISHLLSFLFIYKSVNIALTEWDNDIEWTRVPPNHWNSWDHNTTIKSTLLFNVVLIIIRITTYIISSNHFYSHSLTIMTTRIMTTMRFCND